MEIRPTRPQFKDFISQNLRENFSSLVLSFVMWQAILFTTDLNELIISFSGTRGIEVVISLSIFHFFLVNIKTAFTQYWDNLKSAWNCYKLKIKLLSVLYVDCVNKSINLSKYSTLHFYGMVKTGLPFT